MITLLSARQVSAIRSEDQILATAERISRLQAGPIAGAAVEPDSEETVRRHLSFAERAFFEQAVAAGLNIGDHQLPTHVDTLTRGEAYDRIDVAAEEGVEALRLLAIEWIGHDETVADDPDAAAECLRDYVDQSCLTDETRSNGNSDSDRTSIGA